MDTKYCLLREEREITLASNEMLFILNILPQFIDNIRATCVAFFLTISKIITKTSNSLRSLSERIWRCWWKEKKRKENEMKWMKRKGKKMKWKKISEMKENKRKEDKKIKKDRKRKETKRRETKKWNEWKKRKEDTKRKEKRIGKGKKRKETKQQENEMKEKREKDREKKERKENDSPPLLLWPHGQRLPVLLVLNTRRRC